MVKIMTDSSSLITVEEGQKKGILSIPLCVSIGDIHGRDLRMDMDQFYQMIGDGLLPTSSQPPIGEVVDSFQEYTDQDIINISMADGLSGTYQSAVSARSMVEDHNRITVFNCRTLCGPQNYLVEQAQKMAAAGKDRETILAWLEHAASQTESFLIPQDFSFLRRGGRLTPVAASIGSLLKLKPVMKLTDDGKRLDKFALKRTLSSAVKAVSSYMSEHSVGAGHLLYLTHANAKKDAELIRDHFHAIFPGMEIRLSELGAAFVTQGGPQCIAIQYIKKMDPVLS